MTDPADRHLEERLHALARGVSVPVVPAEADVRRGRRRLVKVRLAMAGATTGTLAVVLGVTGLTAGDPTATEPPVVTRPPSGSLPASPDASPGPDEREPESTRGQGQGDTGSQGRGGAGPGITGTAGSTGGDATDDTAKLPGGEGRPTGEAEGSSDDGPDHWPTNHPTSDPSEEPSDEPTEEPTGTPTGEPTGTPTGQPTDPPTDPPTPPPTTGKVRVHRVLTYFNDVLAERVDPQRAHLQPYDRTVDPRNTTRRDERVFAIGATYRWKDGGDTHGLRVRVASGWDLVTWECGATPSDWQCHDASTPVAEVAVHDGVREVAVEHPDGQVVTVSGELSASGLTEDDLLAAALDGRLIVPGDAPVAPPRLDAGAFGASGEAAMVRAGEAFTTTGYSLAPSVRGILAVEGVDRATLSWSAAPIYSGGGWQCLKSYRLCTDVELADGTVVHVGVLRKKAGWVVQYDGPSYAVRVTSSDPKLPKKRAYPFVVDPAWQPVR